MILTNVSNIIGNAKDLFVDVTAAIESYKQANADNVITQEELKVILEKTSEVLLDIISMAKNIEKTIGKN